MLLPSTSRIVIGTLLVLSLLLVEMGLELNSTRAESCRGAGEGVGLGEGDAWGEVVAVGEGREVETGICCFATPGLADVALALCPRGCRVIS